MLDQKTADKIIKFVRNEPKTIQEISKHIGRSWVTTDTYVKKVKTDTGMIGIKVFRKGTQGALKIAYYAKEVSGDDLQSMLYNQITTATKKTEFDFFEIFQFINDKKKQLTFEQYKKPRMITLLRQAQSVVYIFSGNLSFVKLKEKGVSVIQALEELLERKVRIKILCRVNVASINNIAKIQHLMRKYGDLIEIRHRYQPLRGFVVDEDVGRFMSEESVEDYKEGELEKNLSIFYEVYDKEWIRWLERLFWSLFKQSIEYNSRAKQLNKYFK